MNNKWTSMNKIAVRVSYGVYILALLFVVVMLFFDRYQFEPYAIGALVGLIPSTISHIMWAMYVEMSENIVHIASRNTSETDRTPFRHIADVRQDTCKYVRRRCCQTGYSLEMLLRKGQLS